MGAGYDTECGHQVGLPTRASGNNGQSLTVVSDAISPTYLGAYTSGGGYTVPVVCSYNGTACAWVTYCMQDTLELIPAEVRELRADRSTQARETGERLAAVETNVTLLVGNPQPGRITILEERIDDLRR